MHVFMSVAISTSTYTFGIATELCSFWCTNSHACFTKLVAPVHILHIVPQYCMPIQYEDRLSISYCHSYIHT